MSFGRYMLIPVFIAFQAFTMMVLAPFIPGTHKALGSGAGVITWVAFQAWAVYFLAGCNIKMGAKALWGYFGGILASVAIFELANLLASLNAGGTPWGLYAAVFVVVVPVIMMEKVPGLNFVPAYFVGAGAFFALCGLCKQPDEITCKWTWYGTVAIGEMIACLMGLVYGWITVTFQIWYKGKYEKKAAA